MGGSVKLMTKPLENSVSQTRKPGNSQVVDSSIDRILHLQHTLGNQAVQRMMTSGAIHAKLTISQPGDMYEQEADRVADQVMRMPEPRLQRVCPACDEEEETVQTTPLANQITPLAQRQVEPGKKEEEEEEKTPVQTKQDSEQTQHGQQKTDARIHTLRGGGQPLPASIRTFFEPRFGCDFSHVRVHTDTQAAESAQAVNARAFTVGQDIAFGMRQYAPGTVEGKRLLAHELTHVVQQENSAYKRIQCTEIDDSPEGCQSLKDSSADINQKVNDVLSSVKSEPDGYKRVETVYSTLGRGSPFTGIENWAESLPNDKQNRLKIAQTKYAGNYYPRRGSGFINAWWKGEKTLGTLLKIGTQCVGSDKLGHFFQQGHDYFKISNILRLGDDVAKRFGEWLEGKNPDDPLIAKWIAGMDKTSWPGFDKLMFHKTISKGVFGLSTTGVYSFADLEANSAGMAFYKQLYANPNLRFDISAYLTSNWSENNNLSCYGESMAKVVAFNDPEFIKELNVEVKNILYEKEDVTKQRKFTMSEYYSLLKRLINKHKQKFLCKF